MAHIRREKTSPSTPRISVVERQPLGRLVADRILDFIAQGPVCPGDKLPSERELMEQLGVGRSSVREALNGLALMGIVEIRHGQGAFVLTLPSDISADRLAKAIRRGVNADLLEARETLELATVRLAARRATESDLAEMRSVLLRAEELLRQSQPMAEVSAKFHVLIAQAAHNYIFQEMMSLLAGALEERGPELEQLPGYRTWEVAEHNWLFEAIERHDEERAADRMRSHLGAMAEFLARLE